MKVISYDIGRKNLAWCVVRLQDFSDAAPEILQCKNIALEGSNMQQWVQSMQDQVAKWHRVTLDACLIESQPALNPQAVALAQALHMWYLCHDVPVHFCSSKNKLLNLEDPPVHTKLPKDKYKRRKALSVYHALKLAPESSKEQLEAHSKQDDVCDAYLMAVAWLGRNAVIEL